MTWVAIGAAVAALVLAAALAWWLVRRRQPARIDLPDQAIAAADQGLAGFHGQAAAVGADGQGALVTGAGGRLAVLRPSGRRLLAAEIDWQAVRATPAGIVVDSGDRRVGSLALAGVDALDVRRLMGEGARPRRDGPPSVAVPQLSEA